METIEMLEIKSEFFGKFIAKLQNEKTKVDKEILLKRLLEKMKNGCND